MEFSKLHVPNTTTQKESLFSSKEHVMFISKFHVLNIKKWGNTRNTQKGTNNQKFQIF